MFDQRHRFYEDAINQQFQDGASGLIARLRSRREAGEEAGNFATFETLLPSFPPTLMDYQALI